MSMKFLLGQLVLTTNADATLNSEDMFLSLARHVSGDWGDLCKEDKLENDCALDGHGRLFSSYVDRNGKKFWIITEHDRSVTTVLLPEDY